MSNNITLSVMGMYNQDAEILDAAHFLLPEGVDRDTIIPLILAETAELEVLYPRPDTMKIVVKAWSYARLPSWERMLAALEEEYNPLHNYDRTEVETGSNTGTEGETGTILKEEEISDTGTLTTAEDISDTGSNQTSATTTDQVTGYNTNTFSDNDKQIASGNASSTNARDRDETETRNLSRDRDETETRNLTHSRNLAHSRNLHIFGNIGVTTSAQMLTGELEVRQADIYRIITDEFKRYFCLLIY